MRAPRLNLRSTLIACLVSTTCGWFTLTTESATAYADPAEAASTAASTPPSHWAIAFEKYRLANGLEVILHRDNSIPLVAVNIWYHVGPVNEPKARSGFAHLFEHLMFEGSKHVGPNFDRLLESAGATNSNGTTSWDRTNYFETVPRQHLELVLWIESDRMGFLKDSITQERLDVQRDVVKNERRQTYENAPYGPSALAMLDTLFPEGHPYHGAVIGSMQDLSAATLEDVQAFASAYYTPSNATLTIAGDVDVEATKQWVQKYFGNLRHSPKPPRNQWRYELVASPKRQVVLEPVEVAKVSLGWLAPPAFGPDHAPLNVLTSILADGKSSRLYRSLVVDQRLAVDVDADLDANALASIVSMDAQVASGIDCDVVEQALLAELRQISTVPPKQVELDRAKKRLRLQLESELMLLNAHSGDSGRAGLLQRFNHYLDDPGAITGWYTALQAVGALDVTRVAAKYLDANHRVTVITKPRESKP